MADNRRLAAGLAIIAVGIVLLLGKLGFVGYMGSQLWPMFLLIPGLAFHVLYFNRVLPVGVLVPGGILVTYSLLFFCCATFGWGSLAYLWPVFPLGVAVGLYELYLFGRYRGVIIPALILTGVAVVGLAIAFMVKAGVFLTALILIAVGVYLIVPRRNTRVW